MGNLTWCTLSLVYCTSHHKAWILGLVTLWTVIWLPQKLGQSRPQHFLRWVFILWQIRRLLTHGDDAAPIVPLLITLVIRFVNGTSGLVLSMIKEILHGGSLVLLRLLLFLSILIKHRVVALLTGLSRVVDWNRLCIETLRSLFELVLLLGIVQRILVEVETGLTQTYFCILALGRNLPFRHDVIRIEILKICFCKSIGLRLWHLLLGRWCCRFHHRLYKFLLSLSSAPYWHILRLNWWQVLLAVIHAPTANRLCLDSLFIICQIIQRRVLFCSDVVRTGCYTTPLVKFDLLWLMVRFNGWSLTHVSLVMPPVLSLIGLGLGRWSNTTIRLRAWVENRRNIRNINFSGLWCHPWAVFNMSFLLTQGRLLS